MDRADDLPFTNPDLHLTAAAMVLGGFQAWRLATVTDEEIRRGLNHIQRLSEKHPERTEVLALRGLLRMLGGEKEGAIEDLEAYLAAHGKSRYANMLRMALAALESGADLRRSSPSVVYFGATQSMATGAEAKAEKLFRKALEALAREGPPGPGVGRLLHFQMVTQGRVEIARIITKRAGVLAREGDDTNPLLLEAFTLLDEAVGLGFRNFPRVDVDPDFTPLREHADFEAWRKAWPNKKK
jgi:hypothetical protein